MFSFFQSTFHFIVFVLDMGKISAEKESHFGFWKNGQWREGRIKAEVIIKAISHPRKEDCEGVFIDFDY